MALLFIDGFDNYGSYTNMMRGRWSGVSSSSTAFLSGRFNGKCVQTISASLSVGSSLSFGVLGVAMKFTAGPSSSTCWLNYALLGASTTYAIQVLINTATGVITLYTRTGINTWTSVASSVAGVITDSAWFYLEIKESASSGVVVRVDGVTVINYAGSLASTQSAGLFNAIQWETTYINNLMALDDLYMLDSATGVGSRPMNDFLGDKRVITMFPASNTAVSWTPVPSSVITSPPQVGSTSYVSYSANRLYLPKYISTAYSASGTVRYDPMAIIAQQDCTLQSITMTVQTAVAGIHIRPVVYTEDPLNTNQPLTLHARGDETTGLAAGVNVIPFGSTAPTLAKGTKYWIGFIADAAFSMMGTTVTSPWFYNSATYPTAPTTFSWSGATSSSSNSPMIDYTITATNYGEVQEDDADTVTYNSTSTLNNQDLFGVGPSMSTGVTVYAVQVTGSYKKDDANTRSVANLIKSSTTQVQGSDMALNADYKYQGDLFVLNPATSSEWSAAEVNAAKIGYKVTV